MTINLGAIHDIADLHQLFKRELGFPDWYGENWNAFWDSISALIELKEDLYLLNFPEFERKFPLDAQILKEIIEEYNREGFQFVINTYAEGL